MAMHTAVQQRLRLDLRAMGAAVWRCGCIPAHSSHVFGQLWSHTAIIQIVRATEVRRSSSAGVDQQGRSSGARISRGSLSQLLQHGRAFDA